MGALFPALLFHATTHFLSDLSLRRTVFPEDYQIIQEIANENEEATHLAAVEMAARGSRETTFFVQSLTRTHT